MHEHIHTDTCVCICVRLYMFLHSQHMCLPILEYVHVTPPLGLSQAGGRGLLRISEEWGIGQLLPSGGPTLRNRGKGFRNHGTEKAGSAMTTSMDVHGQHKHENASPEQF